MFKQADRVTENGLTTYQGLVLGMGEKLQFNETLGLYLKYALES